MGKPVMRANTASQLHAALSRELQIGQNELRQRGRYGPECVLQKGQRAVNAGGLSRSILVTMTSQRLAEQLALREAVLDQQNTRS